MLTLTLHKGYVYKAYLSPDNFLGESVKRDFAVAKMSSTDG